jgi:hypothetical protein
VEAHINCIEEYTQEEEGWGVDIAWMDCVTVCVETSTAVKFSTRLVALQPPELQLFSFKNLNFIS